MRGERSFPLLSMFWAAMVFGDHGFLGDHGFWVTTVLGDHGFWATTVLGDHGFWATTRVAPTGHMVDCRGRFWNK